MAITPTEADRARRRNHRDTIDRIVAKIDEWLIQKTPDRLGHFAGYVMETTDDFIVNEIILLYERAGWTITRSFDRNAPRTTFAPRQPTSRE